MGKNKRDKLDYKIHPFVEAACCIIANGKGYDIDKQFHSWLRKYIKEKIQKNGKI